MLTKAGIMISRVSFSVALSAACPVGFVACKNLACATNGSCGLNSLMCPLSRPSLYPTISPLFHLYLNFPPSPIPPFLSNNHWFEWELEPAVCPRSPATTGSSFDRLRWESITSSPSTRCKCRSSSPLSLSLPLQTCLSPPWSWLDGCTIHMHSTAIPRMISIRKKAVSYNT